MVHCCSVAATFTGNHIATRAFPNGKQLTHPALPVPDSAKLGLKPMPTQTIGIICKPPRELLYFSCEQCCMA